MTEQTMPGITLSENAVRRIRELAAAEANPWVGLRIGVSGGGCAGFRYSFSLDETPGPGDRVFEKDGARLLVDEVSLGLLAGCIVDWVEDLQGAAFEIKNPNAISSCSCGASFAA